LLDEVQKQKVQIMEPLNIIVSILYASVFTLSYKRVGIFPALFWPITIVIAGTLVYLTVSTSDHPDQN